jgi:uncharacterized protein YbaP (TraB family)
MTRMQALFRWIASLFLALVSSLSFAAAAQEAESHSADARSAAPAEQTRPALWKVADDDTTIWLFGTIHALPSGIDWFDGAVREAFDGSQELVTEITDTDPVEVQRLVLDRAKLPEGQSLRAMLNPEVKAAYEKQLANLALPVQTFDGFEPWYAALTLSTLSFVRQGYDSANGVEHALSGRAKALGRGHAALETAEFQIGLFDSLPLEAQKRYFAEMVEKLPSSAEQLGEMIEAWRTGDAEALAALMNAEADDPLLIEMILTGRNKTWAGWIDQRLEQPGTVFLAVGAGHLAGEGSVQDQLAARGVSVQRVQ